MSDSAASVSNRPTLSFWQVNKKAYIGGTVVAVLALAAISLAIAQKTGKIDMVKFGQTKAGIITYSVIGGTVGATALGALYVLQKSILPNADREPLVRLPAEPNADRKPLVSLSAEKNAQIVKQLINGVQNSPSIKVIKDIIDNNPSFDIHQVNSTGQTLVAMAFNSYNPRNKDSLLSYLLSHNVSYGPNGEEITTRQLSYLLVKSRKPEERVQYMFELTGSTSLFFKVKNIVEASTPGNRIALTSLNICKYIVSDLRQRVSETVEQLPKEIVPLVVEYIVIEPKKEQKKAIEERDLERKLKRKNIIPLH